ncbi:MAG: GTPase, partial [Candidatus Paceibacterota bacterium]
LKELTKADPKVANYPFTTLEPNLGVYYDLILADIPGLIEGASEGKGLGDKFLRHIERTKIIFHFISAEKEDFKKDYDTIRNELGEYNKDLLKKDEYIFISKTDTAEEKELKEKLNKWKKKVTPISIYNYESIEEVKKILNKIMKDK